MILSAKDYRRPVSENDTDLSIIANSDGTRPGAQEK